jgi:hypothetical protein
MAIGRTIAVATNACGLLLALCSMAQAQLTEPFDHLHLALLDPEQHGVFAEGGCRDASPP